MVQARGVTPVLAVLRALGGFPYTWCPSRQTEGVRVSWVAAAWSTLVVSVMMIFCVASVTTHYTLHLGARHVMRHLLITYWYLLVMVLYLYLAMRAHRLARVLRLLAAAGVSVWRRSWGLEDAPVMAAVAVFLTGTCLSISFTDISTSHPVGDVLRLMADRTADLTITVLLTVFYALVKLLSVEMEDTVAALAYATTTALGRGVSGSEWHTPDTSTQRPLSHSHHSITNTQHPQTPQQHKFRNSLITTTTTQEHAFQSPSLSGRRSKHPAAALLPHVSPVLHLLALDDVLREVVGYASPPLLLLLLNAAASTTMFLYSAIATSSAYYMGFISVLVARMVQIVLIPDPMTRKVNTRNWVAFHTFPLPIFPSSSFLFFLLHLSILLYGTGLPHGRQHRMQPTDHGFTPALSISALVLQTPRCLSTLQLPYSLSHIRKRGWSFVYW